MKQKISISLDGKLITQLEDELHKGFFRNRSHIIEFALNRLMRQKEGGKDDSE